MIKFSELKKGDRIMHSHLGTSPAVETVIRRGAMAKALGCVKRLMAFTTRGRFRRGSPIPMNTMFVMRSPEGRRA